MKEEVKENKEDIAFRIIGGYIGKYTMSYLNKLYVFEFPVENKLEENLSVIELLKVEILKGIEGLKKKEEEDKKAKEETKDKK